MNPQIKRLFVVVLALFTILLCATTYAQFIAAGSLNQNPHNTRANLRAKYQQRGSIIVGDQILAESKEVDSKNGARKEYQRVYPPEANHYAHLLGYLLPSGSASGIEKTENTTLMGQAPSQLGQQIQEELGISARKGGSVKLTLDPALQLAAAKALGQRKGAVVALNYQTGAVLAAVSTPTYDLNRYVRDETYRQQLNQDKEHTPLVNRALTGEYAPGSAFKIVVAAAGIAHNLRTPDGKVDAPVSIKLPGSTARLSNIDNSHCGNGHPTFTYAFAHSCNTPFANLGMELGYPKLKAQADDFGFNTKEAWQIPLYVRTSVFPQRNGQDPGKASLAQASIGQFEVRTNPLLMASVAGAIANGGVQMKPFLVAQELNADGKVTRSYQKGSKLGNPLNQGVADKLKEMMQATVQDGTGEPGQVSNVEMGAKTGTAQVNAKRTNAWYVGYAKTDKYPLAFAVIVEGDQADPFPHGGPAAGPVAKQLVEAARK